MSGTNAGTGQPLYFKCAKCKLSRTYRHDGTWRTNAGDPVRTGRERSAGHHKGARMDSTARQYKCLTCGHIGWSRHFEVRRLPLLVTQT